MLTSCDIVTLKYITRPIKLGGHTGRGRDAMFLLKHKILKSILLRRTKVGRSADLALPPKMIFLRRDSLDIKEEDYLRSLYNDTQAQFNTYAEGTVVNNYANIYDRLMRVRQALNHPYLVVYSKNALSQSSVANDDGEVKCGLCHESVEDPVFFSSMSEYFLTCRYAEGTVVNNYANIYDRLMRVRQALNHPYLVVYSKNALSQSSVANDDGEVKCGLCHESVEDPVVNACGHTFCQFCMINFSASAGQGSCPTCFITGFKSSSILNRIRLHDFKTSTKLEALREEIRFMVQRDGTAKGIVFSQFPSFLDLIHYSLQKSGVQCVQLDGSTNMKARNTAIKRFNEDPDCKLFLMSLKAGGTALNLTVASHREEIRFMVQRDGTAKGVVFSQFPSFLDLIHYSLQKSGVQCVQLDGSTNMKARDTAIKRFNEDPDCRLFLTSLKAGGTALNLTVASHVFLMDVWWNPAVEQQAQDRVHRIGQFKPVRQVPWLYSYLQSSSTIVQPFF
uniref:RING-type domain-containing protein n=1 Tax=Daucus carota subsp. sativus TaxID=79200 RepID=A0A162B2T3_DAUCS